MDFEQMVLLKFIHGRGVAGISALQDDVFAFYGKTTSFPALGLYLMKLRDGGFLRDRKTLPQTYEVTETGLEALREFEYGIARYNKAFNALRPESPA